MATTTTTLALIIKLCLRFTEGGRESNMAAERVSYDKYKSYSLQGRLSNFVLCKRYRAFLGMTFTYTLSERRGRTDEVEEAEKTASHSSSSSVAFPELQASILRSSALTAYDSSFSEVNKLPAAHGRTATPTGHSWSEVEAVF